MVRLASDFGVMVSVTVMSVIPFPLMTAVLVIEEAVVRGAY